MSIEKFKENMGTIKKDDVDNEIRGEVTGSAGDEAERKKEEYAMAIIRQGMNISFICELTGFSEAKIIELSKIMAEGRGGTKEEVAIEMIKEDLNTFLISKATDLPEEKVSGLKSELWSIKKFKMDMAALKQDAVNRASAQGWAEGWAEVRTGGKVKREKELAIAMLKKKIDIFLICEITEFPKETIDELSKIVAKGEDGGKKGMAIRMLKKGLDISLVCEITKIPEEKVTELSKGIKGGH